MGEPTILEDELRIDFHKAIDDIGYTRPRPKGVTEYSYLIPLMDKLAEIASRYARTKQREATLAVLDRLEDARKSNQDAGMAYHHQVGRINMEIAKIRAELDQPNQPE